MCGLSAPPRSRPAARQPRPAGARRARSARVSLPRASPLVRSVHAPRALASLRSTAPLVLPSLGLSLAPLPLRLPALLTPRGALAPCRSLGGGAFHAPRGISPPVTKPKFYFRLPLKQACRPQQTKQVFCIIRVGAEPISL